MAAPLNCRKCGLTSILRDRFEKGLCPACQPEPIPASHAGGLIGTVAGLGLLLAVMAMLAHPSLNFFEVFVPVVIAYYLGPLRAFLHEASHYLAGRLSGWAIPEVRVGAGEERTGVRLGRTRWTIGQRLVPASGYCMPAPEPGRVKARAIAAFLLAPAVMQLGIAVALVPLFDVDTYLGRTAILFAYFSVVEVVWSVVPHRTATSYGMQDSDGTYLFRLLRAPRRETVEWGRRSVIFQVYLLFKADRKSEALEVADAAVPLLPDDWRTRGMRAWVGFVCDRPDQGWDHIEDYVRYMEEIGAGGSEENGGFEGEEAVEYWRGSLLVLRDRLDEVVELSERRVAQADDEESRARWSGCLAMAILLRGVDDESVTRAADAAAYAFDRVPWVSYVLTAQGMALIERGERDEGLALFDFGDEKLTEDAGIRAAWRVVAHAGSGHRDRAEAAMERLREARVWPACLRRAEAALTA